MSVPAIRVKNLTKHFKNKVALAGITFEVQPGEIFGYVGPNGAGKTTTIRILLGSMTPTGGTAEIFGQNVTQDREQLNRTVGFVLEELGLYDRLTAHQNVDYYARLYGLTRDERSERISRLLEQVGLERQGNQAAGAFSKGMRKRLAIARALVHNPSLLFLDEPTEGLDPEGRKAILDLLESLAQRLTILLTSHNLDEVQRICSRIGILRCGQLLACDTLENLARARDDRGLEITLLTATPPARLDSILTTLSFLKGYQLDGLSLRIGLSDMAFAPTLLKRLLDEGIAVAEVRPVVRSLEDVYLSLMKGGS